jgi:RNA polymerase-binding transcription factor DksA
LDQVVNTTFANSLRSIDEVQPVEFVKADGGQYQSNSLGRTDAIAKIAANLESNVIVGLQFSLVLRRGQAGMTKNWSKSLAVSERRLRKLVDETSGESAVAVALPKDRIAGDEGDLAQVVIDGEIAQRVADLRASLQEQLAKALDRLALGRYGYCEDCGKPIPAERLEFAPETTTCVPCQGRRDRNR